MASRKAHPPSSNPMQSFKDWEIVCWKSRQKWRGHISSISCCRRGYSRPNKCWTATKGGNYSVIHWSNGRLGALRKYFWIFSSAGDNFPLQAIGGPSQFYPLWQLWITPNNKKLFRNLLSFNGNYAFCFKGGENRQKCDCFSLSENFPSLGDKEVLFAANMIVL